MHSTMPACTAPAVPDHDRDPARDVTLLRAFREQGDRQALSELYQRHAGASYAVALRLTGEPAAAEDAVQDGLIALMTCAGQYRERPEAGVRSWILALVANAARRRQRENRRRARRERAHGQGVMSDPAGGDAHVPAWDAEELGREVRQALKSLPEQMRVPVLLRHADELSIRDIATTLGRKEKTVRSQIERGIEHLHLLLVRRGDAVAPASLLMVLGRGGPSRPPPRLLTRLEGAAHAAVVPAATAALSLKAMIALMALAGIMVTALALSLIVRRSPAAVVPPVAVTTPPSLPQPVPVVPPQPALADEPPAIVPQGVPVSDAVLGRFLDADGHAIDGRPDPAGARLPRPWSPPMAALPTTTPAPWTTGIKALDLFAPMVRGGRIDLYGPAGVGRMVLVCELAERMRRSGGRTVLVGWDQNAGDGAGLMADLRHSAFQPPGTVLVWQRLPVALAQARRAIETAAIMATAFRDQHHEVLLVVFLDAHLPTGLELAAATGILPAGGSTTLLVCHPLNEVPQTQTLPAGTDARIVLGLGPEFAGEYPAIDPFASFSRWPGPDQVQDLAEQQAARAALRTLRDRAALIGAPGAAADPALGRASRLHAYLSQPFFVTVSFLGLAGTSVTPQQSHAVITKILAGAYDDIPVSAFRYIGASPR